MDLLAVMASIFVVGIHCNGILHEYAATYTWKVSALANAIYYPANAIFFMLSGAKLLDYRKRYSTEVFFQKRLVRILVPFFFWSCFGILCKYFFHELEGFSIREIIRLLATNGCVYSGIYWFLYALVGIYLSYPVLSLIPDEYKQRIFAYFVFASWLGYSVQPFIQHNYLQSWNEGLPVEFAVSSQYLIYAVWGYYINQYPIKKRLCHTIYLYGVVSFLLLSVGTIILSDQSGSFNARYCGWSGFASFGMASALFIFVKQHFNVTSEKKRCLLRKLSDSSFGVYLLHSFPIWCVKHYFPDANGLWMFGGVPALCIFYLLALGIVMLGKKIPVVKYLFP